MAAITFDAVQKTFARNLALFAHKTRQFRTIPRLNFDLVDVMIGALKSA